MCLESVVSLVALSRWWLKQLGGKINVLSSVDIGRNLSKGLKV